MGASARASVWVAAAAVLAVLALVFASTVTRSGASDARANRGPDCANAHTHPSNLNQREAGKAIRCLINERRRSHGAKPLSANGKLGRASQKHTNHMRNHGCFAHQCPGEADMVTRIKSTGYLSSALAWSVGENIAWGGQGLGSPANIVESWMNSPPHRANMLDRGYEDIGVGVAHGTPSSPHADGAIYTTDFGFKRG